MLPPCTDLSPGDMYVSFFSRAGLLQLRACDAPYSGFCEWSGTDGRIGASWSIYFPFPLIKEIEIH